ncbi:MAG TPA: GMC family oxidoreductase [Gemmatimonadaceae bacterium]|nr:GMC family oxidoreductase [Gemmatimonadaceae bacterium]
MFFQQREEYDAIVVGSGISGGWAAKELTEKGLRTLVLDRGAEYPYRTGYITEHKPSWSFPFHDRRLDPDKQGTAEYQIQSRTGSFRESTRHTFLNDRKHPYEEAKPFTWIQGGRVGGRSTMWGRQVYRWSDLDFEANAKEGIAVDWPIRYADVAPWYSYVERFIGVSGEKLGLPYLPDGEFQPPMEMNAGEKFVKRGFDRSFPDRRFTIGRVAILTRDLPQYGRAACHFCGPCERGCSTGSYFSSQASTFPAAMKTGRFTLRPNSVVHSLIYDEGKNRVTGVRVIDAETKETREYYARLVFLNASTLGSTRILLNSKSPRFPNGLANSSGALGKYLMDHHFMVGARGDIPGLTDRYYQGNRPNGIYIPRFRNLGDDRTKRTDFVRGYGYQGGASREGWGRGGSEPGIGVALKRRLRDAGDWGMSIIAFGECLPREENYVELSDKTDEYGVPTLRISAGWGPNEMAMRTDMEASAAEMLEAAGVKNVNTYNALSPDRPYGAEPGLGIHEMGTARMGRDPKTSVLNAHNQAHDVPNLFVTDGACMTSSACQNPSITYMALTARAVDFAVGEMTKNNL